MTLVVTMFCSIGRIVSWITAGFIVRWIVVSCLSDSELRSDGSIGTMGPVDICLLWPLSVVVPLPVLFPLKVLLPEVSLLEAYPVLPVLEVLYPEPVLDEMLGPPPVVPDRCCKSRLAPPPVAWPVVL